MIKYLFSETLSLHVAVGNRFESCEEFDPTDFLSVAHVQYRGMQVVTLNETVTGRFVTLYLNGTGVLQLYDVMVFGASPGPGKSLTTMQEVQSILSEFFNVGPG